MVFLEKQNYDSNFKAYKKMEALIKNYIIFDVSINHVGSTAIPVIEYGKNIIDILIGVHSKTEFEEVAKILTQLKFFGSDNSKNEIYQFFASKTEETMAGDTHIHLAMIGTDRYNDFLIIKNYLLSNKEEAEAYSNLKLKLIADGIVDRQDYKKIKGEYVTSLLARAREEFKKK